MLFLKATSYRKPPAEPYTWASGMKMRIYNDNRMMLGCYKHRIRISFGFRALINLLIKPSKKNSDDLYILGTSMAGIAPAASVAQLMNKKMLINHNDQFYLFESNLVNKKTLGQMRSENADAIVSTIPFAIPYGVQYANKLKIGFAYIRKPKDHGKKQQIEGNLKPGSKVILMACVISEKDINDAMEFKLQLEEMGYKVITRYFIEKMMVSHTIIKSEELKGVQVVVIEDLFSTGGSAAYEVYQLRKAGAVCNHCFSIFSYEFDVLKKQFSGERKIGATEARLLEPCKIVSLLPFSTLKMETEKMNFYSSEVREAMFKEIDEFDINYKKFLSLSH
jgi:orotate phosphoribosyltransferase